MGGLCSKELCSQEPESFDEVPFGTDEGYDPEEDEGLEELDAMPPESRAQAVLADGSLRLLSAAWLMSQAEDYIIQRRQELPREAFLSPSAAAEKLNVMFGIVAMSYGWLSQWHPDPVGFHLYYVRCYLEKHLRRFSDLSDVGVFWDFAGLPQCGTDGTERTPREERTWRRGIRALSALFGSKRTVVVQLTAIPDDPHELTEDEQFYRSPYLLRGWCFFECTVAVLLKDADQLLDLGNATRELEDVGTNWDTVQQRARGSRLPPLNPEDMAEELANRQFTVGDDVTYLTETYAEFFGEAASEATWLWFENSCPEYEGWGDEEIQQFARSLPYFTNCQAVRLWGHHGMSQEGLTTLTALLPEQTALGRLLLPKHLELTDAGEAMKTMWVQTGKSPGSLVWC